MARFSKLFLFLGLLLIFHAAYSAVQHRSFLKLAEEEYTGLPSDIGAECLLASVLMCVGVVTMVGRFRDIKLTTELNKRTYEMSSNRDAFMTFNHRGHSLYPVLGSR
ncbi:Membrane magnesium transporter 2 [Geodia barretti]|uniref:Membrane magnesium transporter n=1 Tax=Geodia barretti TaxID=519541 RepID=A0AA35WLL9_GEOBA|nr:Membrane magnesium transporter 2 [Geodia barretti]